MDPAFWERVEALYFASLDRSAAERAAFLDNACAGDLTVRREVDAQLAAFADDPEFLETPIARVVGLTPADSLGGPLRTKHIGSYRLIRPLARGGMGEVYLAVHEAEDFHQTVALKLVRAELDSEEVIRRFRLERQILASLSHPNIAQLLDGGATEDGRPYFVMEYVDGERLDDYCDRNRLSIRRRLELFQIICGAVQHAHQNLVVHRDLKPGNIMVTANGVPKLLDFGIGKVLTPSGELGPTPETRTRVRVLTPEYASPEQIQGELITTASDVYALGLLLFELLAGHHPFTQPTQTLDELERAIRETEPPRPSVMVSRPAWRRKHDGAPETVAPDELSARRGTDLPRLRGQLAGDLDHIALKALRKEPARRYPSAAALAEDIQRHVDGLPVRARADTVAYRAGKFVRRHAWAVATGVIAFAALTATTLVTLAQSRRVTRERDRAVEVRSFLLETFGATGANRATGNAVTARQLLDVQAAQLDRAYTDRPEIRAEMMEVVADGYDRLGLYGEAERLARRALELRRATLGERHPDVAASLNLLGWVLHEKGQSAEAEPLLREAVAIRRAAGRRYRVDLARSLNDLGVVVQRLGKYDTAQTLYREALDIRLRRLGPEHRGVGVTANNLATLLYNRGDYAAAVPAAEQALAALRAAVGPDHQRSVIAQSNLAVMKAAAGQLESAERELRDLLQRQRRLQGPDHPVTTQQMVSLAGVLNQQEKFTEAESVAREALGLQRTTLGPKHPNVANSVGALGDAVAGQGRYPEALELFQRSLAIRREVLGARHPQVGASLADIAGVYAKTGDVKRAEQHYGDALAVLEAAHGVGDPRTTTLRARIGRLLLDAGRPREALAVFREAHAASVGKLPAHLAHETRLGMAEAFIGLGDYAVAESLVVATSPGPEAGPRSRAIHVTLERLQAALAANRGPARP